MSDQASVKMDAQTATVTLALENRLSDLQRSQNRKYTAQDQEMEFSGDLSMNFITTIQDIQIFWR